MENADGIFEFLEYQYKKVYSGIRNLSEKEVQKFEGWLEDSFQRYVFQLICEKDCVYNILVSQRTQDKIRKGTKVIIYGAGYAIKDVIEYLNKLCGEVISIAVTRKIGNPKALYGHRVVEIDQLIEYNQEAIVLVAANKKYHDEIQNTLVQLGFMYYEFLDIVI